MASKFKHLLLYGDTHIPFQCDATLGVVQQVARDVKPDIIVNMGDLVDAWQISRFPKDPRRKDNLQTDITLAAMHLAEFEANTSAKRYLYLGGNHENRLKTAIWTFTESARELAGLDVFERYVNWPTILRDAGMPKAWEFYEYDSEQPVQNIIPRMLLKHGSVVRKWSGMSARGEWERYGYSGASGHVHRLADFLHRDYHGCHRWIETGCTCDLQATPPGGDHDWHNGCVVITMGPNDWWNAELVFIEDGVGQWREHWYEHRP